MSARKIVVGNRVILRNWQTQWSRLTSLTAVVKKIEGDFIRVRRDGISRDELWAASLWKRER